MPCDMYITKGHHAGLVVRDYFCLCQPWIVPGLHPSGTTPEKGPSPGPPWPGHLWALWSHPVAGRKQMPTFLSERKCCHDERHIFSNEKGQSGREGGIFPLPRKDNQSGEDAGHPETLCQTSAYHSGPQQVNKCSVLSLSNSNSPFIWDGGHIHPTNARPTVAWQGQSRSWMEHDSPQSWDIMREKEVDIPAAGITSGTMSFWFQIHHIWVGGPVGSHHLCHQQRKA